MELLTEISQMGGSGNPGLRRYSMKLEKKVHKSNKRYETRVKGIELKVRLRILKKKMRNYETKRFFFRFAKQLETLLSYFRIFPFRETIETRRNSDLFRTVSYFAKLKKIRNCQPWLCLLFPLQLPWLSIGQKA